MILLVRPKGLKYLKDVVAVQILSSEKIFCIIKQELYLSFFFFKFHEI